MADFLNGYLEAIAFTEFHSDSDGMAGMDVTDIGGAFLAACEADCAAFEDSHADSLELAYWANDGQYTATQAGIDFWLTRNGHGAGFWDRGLGKTGDELTIYAHAFGGVDVYVGDDGKVYST